MQIFENRCFHYFIDFQFQKHPKRDEQLSILGRGGLENPFEKRLEIWFVFLFTSLKYKFYDSDKSIQGREKNYPKLWDMLNNGGIFISDDINDNMSFFKFCDVINKKPLVIKYKKKFQGIILK